MNELYHQFYDYLLGRGYDNWETKWMIQSLLYKGYDL